MQPRSDDVQELAEYIDQMAQQLNRLNVALSAHSNEVSKQELNIIGIVGRAGSCIMREVAERSGLAMSSITPIMDKLEEKKLIIRTRDTTDRRIVRAELSTKGKKVHETEMEGFRGLSRTILSTLSHKEQEQFLMLFRKIQSGIGSQGSETV